MFMVLIFFEMFYDLFSLFVFFMVWCVLVVIFVVVEVVEMVDGMDDIGIFVYDDNGGSFEIRLVVFEGVEVY